MSFIHHFCITSKNYSFLENLNIDVILSGAINKDLTKFPTKWFKDSTGENISDKNINFGTLSSHYWFWKNKSPLMKKDDWIAFNHYRRFWVKENSLNEIKTENLNENILREVPSGNFDVLLPEKIELKNLKLSKLLKKGFLNYIKNPKILFNRKRYSINLHFDLFHGYNLLNRATELLDEAEKETFRTYINTENSFYPLQIFIIKKKFLDLLYEKTFKWIFKCEKTFGNMELKGYGKERLYDFLAERYFSYFFEKNLKIKTWSYILLEEKLNEI